MNKATVNMTDWQLYVYKEEYMLSGTADNHPFLGKNTYVSRTSCLVDYIFEDDVLVYETRNTVYICPLKYMSIWPYSNVRIEYKYELNHRADNSDSMLDQIIAATAKLSLENDKKNQETSMEQSIARNIKLETISKDFSDDEMLNRIKKLQEFGQQEIEEKNKREHNRLIEIARRYDNCVYIEVFNVGEGSLLAYHFGDCTGVVYPCLHSGMFQDSVLYIKYAMEDDPCRLDFRYFPKGWDDIMKTYVWSDNINQVVIKNETGRFLKFNHVEIPMGETAVIKSDKHCQ